MHGLSFDVGFRFSSRLGIFLDTCGFRAAGADPYVRYLGGAVAGAQTWLGPLSLKGGVGFLRWSDAPYIRTSRVAPIVLVAAGLEIPIDASFSLGTELRIAAGSQEYFGAASSEAVATGSITGSLSVSWYQVKHRIVRGRALTAEERSARKTQRRAEEEADRREAEKRSRCDALLETWRSAEGEARRTPCLEIQRECKGRYASRVAPCR